MSEVLINKENSTIILTLNRERVLNALNLKEEAAKFLKHVFNKELNLEFQEIMLIDKSIPQYDVGHLDKIMHIEELSPNNLTLLGSYMYGVSLIDIVIKSKELARNFIRQA